MAKKSNLIGIEATKRIVAQKNRPTALICAYDEIAMSLIHQFNKNSILVPDDISVMGINNISSSATGSARKRPSLAGHRRSSSNHLSEKQKRQANRLFFIFNI